MYEVKPISPEINSSGRKTLLSYKWSSGSVVERNHALKISSQICFEVNGFLPNNPISASIWTPLVELTNVNLIKTGDEPMEKKFRRYTYSLYVTTNLFETSYYKNPMGVNEPFDLLIYYTSNVSVLQQSNVRFESDEDYQAFVDDSKYMQKIRFSDFNNTIDLTGKSNTERVHVYNFNEMSSDKREVVITKAEYEPTKSLFNTLFSFDLDKNQNEQANILEHKAEIEYTLKGSNEIKKLPIEPCIEVVNGNTTKAPQIQMKIKDWVVYDKHSKELKTVVSNEGGIFVEADCDIRIKLLAKVKFKDTVRFFKYAYNFTTKEQDVKNIDRLLNVSNGTENVLNGEYHALESRKIF